MGGKLPRPPSMGLGRGQSGGGSWCAADHWQPSLVLMVGICGGRSEKVTIGDVIVADSCYHYQFGAYKEGTVEHELRYVEIGDSLRHLVVDLKGLGEHSMPSKTRLRGADSRALLVIARYASDP